MVSSKQRAPEACTTKRAQHTQGIFSLSGLTNPNKRDYAKRSYKGGYQLRVSPSGCERVHMNWAVFAASDQSLTWTSLLTCRQTDRQTHFTKED